MHSTVSDATCSSWQSTNPADTKGIEAELAALDARQADVEKLAAATRRSPPAASIPGVVVEERPSGSDIPPGPLSSVVWGWRWSC